MIPSICALTDHNDGTSLIVGSSSLWPLYAYADLYYALWTSLLPFPSQRKGTQACRLSGAQLCWFPPLLFEREEVFIFFRILKILKYNNHAEVTKLRCVPEMVNTVTISS